MSDERQRKRVGPSPALYPSFRHTGVSASSPVQPHSFRSHLINAFPATVTIWNRVHFDRPSASHFGQYARFKSAMFRPGFPTRGRIVIGPSRFAERRELVRHLAEPCDHTNSIKSSLSEVRMRSPGESWSSSGRRPNNGSGGCVGARAGRPATRAHCWRTASKADCWDESLTAPAVQT